MAAPSTATALFALGLSVLPPTYVQPIYDQGLVLSTLRQATHRPGLPDSPRSTVTGACRVRQLPISG